MFSHYLVVVVYLQVCLSKLSHCIIGSKTVALNLNILQMLFKYYFPSYFGVECQMNK